MSIIDLARKVLLGPHLIERGVDFGLIVPFPYDSAYEVYNVRANKRPARLLAVCVMVATIFTVLHDAMHRDHSSHLIATEVLVPLSVILPTAAMLGLTFNTDLYFAYFPVVRRFYVFYIVVAVHALSHLHEAAHLRTILAPFTKFLLAATILQRTRDTFAAFLIASTVNLLVFDVYIFNAHSIQNLVLAMRSVFAATIVNYLSVLFHARAFGALVDTHSKLLSMRRVHARYAAIVHSKSLAQVIETYPLPVPARHSAPSVLLAIHFHDYNDVFGSSHDAAYPPRSQTLPRTVRKVLLAELENYCASLGIQSWRAHGDVLTLCAPISAMVREYHQTMRYSEYYQSLERTPPSPHHLDTLRHQHNHLFINHMLSQIAEVARRLTLSHLALMQNECPEFLLPMADAVDTLASSANAMFSSVLFNRLATANANGGPNHDDDGGHAQTSATASTAASASTTPPSGNASPKSQSSRLRRQSSDASFLDELLQSSHTSAMQNAQHASKQTTPALVSFTIVAGYTLEFNPDQLCMLSGPAQDIAIQNLQHVSPGDTKIIVHPNYESALKPIQTPDPSKHQPHAQPKPAQQPAPINNEGHNGSSGISIMPSIPAFQSAPRPLRENSSSPSSSHASLTDAMASGNHCSHVPPGADPHELGPPPQHDDSLPPIHARIRCLKMPIVNTICSKHMDSYLPTSQWIEMQNIIGARFPALQRFSEAFREYDGLGNLDSEDQRANTDYAAAAYRPPRRNNRRVQPQLELTDTIQLASGSELHETPPLLTRRMTHDEACTVFDILSIVSGKALVEALDVYCDNKLNRLNAFTDPKTENRFRTHRQVINARILRIMLILLAVRSTVFTVVEVLLFEMPPTRTIAVRTFFTVPVIIIAFALTYTHFFVRHSERFSAVVAVLVGSASSLLILVVGAKWAIYGVVDLFITLFFVHAGFFLRPRSILAVAAVLAAQVTLVIALDPTMGIVLKPIGFVIFAGFVTYLVRRERLREDRVVFSLNEVGEIAKAQTDTLRRILLTLRPVNTPMLDGVCAQTESAVFIAHLEDERQPTSATRETNSTNSSETINAPQHETLNDDDVDNDDARSDEAEVEESERQQMEASMDEALMSGAYELPETRFVAVLRRIKPDNFASSWSWPEVKQQLTLLCDLISLCQREGVSVVLQPDGSCMLFSDTCDVQSIEQARQIMLPVLTIIPLDLKEQMPPLTQDTKSSHRTSSSSSSSSSSRSSSRATTPNASGVTGTRKAANGRGSKLESIPETNTLERPSTALALEEVLQDEPEDRRQRTRAPSTRVGSRAHSRASTRNTVSRISRASTRWSRQDAERLAELPTMGILHHGTLRLVDQHGDRIWVQATARKRPTATHSHQSSYVSSMLSATRRPRGTEQQPQQEHYVDTGANLAKVPHHPQLMQIAKANNIVSASPNAADDLRVARRIISLGQSMAQEKAQRNSNGTTTSAAPSSKVHPSTSTSLGRGSGAETSPPSSPVSGIDKRWAEEAMMEEDSDDELTHSESAAHVYDRDDAVWSPAGSPTRMMAEADTPMELVYGDVLLPEWYGQQRVVDARSEHQLLPDRDQEVVLSGQVMHTSLHTIMRCLEESTASDVSMAMVEGFVSNSTMVQQYNANNLSSRWTTDMQVNRQRRMADKAMESAPTDATVLAHLKPDAPRLRIGRITGLVHPFTLAFNDPKLESRYTRMNAITTRWLTMFFVIGSAVMRLPWIAVQGLYLGGAQMRMPFYVTVGSVTITCVPILGVLIDRNRPQRGRIWSAMSFLVGAMFSAYVEYLLRSGGAPSGQRNSFIVFVRILWFNLASGMLFRDLIVLNAVCLLFTSAASLVSTEPGELLYTFLAPVQVSIITMVCAFGIERMRRRFFVRITELRHQERDLFRILPDDDTERSALHRAWWSCLFQPAAQLNISNVNMDMDARLESNVHQHSALPYRLLSHHPWTYRCGFEDPRLESEYEEFVAEGGIGPFRTVVMWSWAALCIGAGSDALMLSPVNQAYYQIAIFARLIIVCFLSLSAYILTLMPNKKLCLRSVANFYFVLMFNVLGLLATLVTILPFVEQIGYMSALMCFMGAVVVPGTVRSVDAVGMAFVQVLLLPLYSLVFNFTPPALFGTYTALLVTVTGVVHIENMKRHHFLISRYLEVDK